MKSLAILLVLVGTTYADSPQPTPFDRGKLGLSIALGRQDNLGYQYIAAGVGASYYLVDGLSAGLFVQHEFGDGPSLSSVTPSLTYVVQPLVHASPIVPYVGALFTHWFIGEPYQDQDAIGARAGGMIIQGPAVLGIGVLVQHAVSSCDTSCTSVGPDISIGFAL